MPRPVQVLLCLLLSTACHHTANTGAGLAETVLPAEFYTIDVTNDTVLKMAGGLLLHIPAGALDAGGADTVRLAIRKACCITDMIRARLVTRSDGEPLSSGGMIDIEAAAGQQLKFKRAIAVAIPADRLQEGMQVYKGRKDEEGKINWVDPMPLLPDSGSFQYPGADSQYPAAGKPFYSFRVQTAGWYNVDVSLKGLPGFEDSELTVRLQEQFREGVNLYLVMPGRRVLCEGGPLQGRKDEYGFWKDDATIPLPQGETAYILALGEQEGKPVFGKVKFVISRKQSPQPELAVVTKEEMNREIGQLDSTGLSR